MRLKDIREESELKQFTVSKKLGVSRGTYSLWELELDPIPIKRLNDLGWRVFVLWQCEIRNKLDREVRLNQLIEDITKNK